jgi:hypothetical protein
MKLLLVLGSDDNYDIIAQYVRPLGFELIRYRQALKAMDNVEEINPHALIISASDFPRHWKILVQFVRGERSKNNCPIILFKGKNFSTEESSKASFLGVNGLIDESLDSISELKRLQNILSRYVPAHEKRKGSRFYVDSRQRLGFVFVHPANRAIVTGELKTISAGGVSFLPAVPSQITGVLLNMTLDECSLRVGEDIVSPICRVTRIGRMLSMEFVSFPGNEKRSLENYLEELPVREFMLKSI